jgi:hypothetical protein
MAEPKIVQKATTTGRLSSTGADATIRDRIRPPTKTTFEDQEEQVKIRTHEMGAILNVALIQDTKTGAILEADVAISPLVGRP